ncbi:hypothetical protein AOLI_G00147980 [Acnodon oligacanthus]
MEHPHLRALQRENFIWTLASVPLLEQFLPVLDGDPLQEVVKKVIEQFKNCVVPKLNSFRKCGPAPVWALTGPPILGMPSDIPSPAAESHLKALTSLGSKMLRVGAHKRCSDPYPFQGAALEMLRVQGIVTHRV